VPRLASAEFYDGAFLALAEPGALVVNFMDDDPKFDLTLQRLERAFGGAVIVMPALYDPNILAFALKEIPAAISWHELRSRAEALESRLGLPFTRYVSRLRAMNRWTARGPYNLAMKLSSDSFPDGGAIPAHHAFCVADAASAREARAEPQSAARVVRAAERHGVGGPHLPRPRRAIEGRRRQQGRPHDPASLAARQLLPLGAGRHAASGSPIRDGEFSSGVTSKARAARSRARNTRQGLNDYTAWFANDKDMAGDYFRLRRAVPAVERRDPAPLRVSRCLLSTWTSARCSASSPPPTW
jgi:hypothetical protein